MASTQEVMMSLGQPELRGDCLQFKFVPKRMQKLKNSSILNTCLLSITKMLLNGKQYPAGTFPSVYLVAFTVHTKQTYAFGYEIYVLIFNHHFIIIIFLICNGAQNV